MSEDLRLPSVTYGNAYWVVVEKLNKMEGLSMFTEQARRAIADIVLKAIMDMREVRGE